MIGGYGGFKVKGKVLRPSKGNLFLITSEKIPPIGSDVLLKDGTKAGSLRDVIGKVEQPLLVVSVSEVFKVKLKPGTTVFMSAPAKASSKRRVRR